MNKFLALVSALAIAVCCIAQAQGGTVIEDCQDILEAVRELIKELKMPECASAKLRQCGFYESKPLTADEWKKMVESCSASSTPVQDPMGVSGAVSGAAEKECYTQCEKYLKTVDWKAKSETMLQNIEEGVKQKCVTSLQNVSDCFIKHFGWN